MTSLQLARRLTGVASTRIGQSPAASTAPDRATTWTLDGRHRDAGERRLLAAGDILALALATGAAELVFKAPGHGLFFGVLTIVLWLAVFQAYGLYDHDLAPLRPQVRDELPALLSAAVVACLATAALRAIVVGSGPNARGLGVLVAVGIAAVVVLRTVARRAAGVVLGPERVLLAGEADAVESLARSVAAHPDLGLETAGVVACDGKLHVASPVLGHAGCADLSAIAAEHGVTHVLVASSSLGTSRLLEELRPCRRRGIKVTVMRPVADALSPRAADDDGDLGVLGAEVALLSPFARAAKRTVDIVGSGVALVLAAPVMALLAIAVRLDSPGSALFHQERVGRGGRVFRLVKFRTMVTDAERMTEALRAHSLDPDWLLLDRDPRITRLGRLLRQWSLDELPQLWNVLRGDMSLVGPRPLILAEDDRVREWARSRDEIPPGLTGLWQIAGRTSISFEEMIRLDCVYVSGWSLWRDLGIIARTVPAVLSRRGAN